MGRTYCKDTPLPREFDCRRCGDRVFVDQPTDHRTVFCSQYCEREFWRHRERYERNKNIARGHVVQGWQLEKVYEK